MVDKILLILTALLLFPAVVAAQVTVGSSVRRELRVRSETGSVEADLSVIQVRTALPRGQSVNGSLIVFFDPASQLFWWMHESSTEPSDPATVRKEFLDSHTFSVHSDQIVCFIAEGRTLWVRTSEMRAANLDEGITKALSSLPEELSRFVSGDMTWFQQVPLAEAVGQTFFHPKNIGDPAVRLKITTVDRLPSGWRIEIENDKGECKTVTMTRDFKVVPGGR